MEAMRQSWTDDRLDDFRAETQRRFAQVDKRFDKVEGQIEDLGKRMDARFDAMDARLDARSDAMDARLDARFEGMEERFDARFDALQRMMLWFCGAMIVTLFGVVLTQGWFMFTQL